MTPGGLMRAKSRHFLYVFIFNFDLHVFEISCIVIQHYTDAINSILYQQIGIAKYFSISFFVFLNSVYIFNFFPLIIYFLKCQTSEMGGSKSKR